MVNFKYFLSSFTCSNSIVHVVHHQRNSLKPFFSYLFNLKWITQCNVQPHKNGLNQRCFFFNDIYLLLKAFALCSEFFSSTLTCTLPCSRPNRFVFPNQPHYYCLGPRSTLLCRFLTPSFHALFLQNRAIAGHQSRLPMHIVQPRIFFDFSFHLKSHDTNSNSEPQRQRKPCRLVVSGDRNGKSGVSVFSSPSKLKLNPQKLIIHSVLTRPAKIVAGPANAAMTRQELKIKCHTHVTYLVWQRGLKLQVNPDDPDRQTSRLTDSPEFLNLSSHDQTKHTGRLIRVVADSSCFFCSYIYTYQSVCIATTNTHSQFTKC